MLVEPKSRAGRRTIKLPDALRDALRAHRVRQTEQRLAAANAWDDRGFVFCQPNGHPIDRRRDWQDWKDLLKAAVVRDARLHDARHTAATLLLQQGVPARVVMNSRRRPPTAWGTRSGADGTHWHTTWRTTGSKRTSRIS